MRIFLDITYFIAITAWVNTSAMILWQCKNIYWIVCHYLIHHLRRCCLVSKRPRDDLVTQAEVFGKFTFAGYLINVYREVL